MSDSLKIRKIGGSLGVILPKNVTDALAIQEGDELYANVTDDGLTLSPFDPDFEDALEDARAFMRSHRDAFRKLAQ